MPGEGARQQRLPEGWQRLAPGGRALDLGAIDACCDAMYVGAKCGTFDALTQLRGNRIIVRDTRTPVCGPVQESGYNI